MLSVPESMTEGWLASYKGGSARATTRITVQKMDMKLLNYDLSTMGSFTLEGNGTFATMPFGQASVPVELKNIRNCTWSRSLNSFTAEGTVTIWNTEQLPVGALGEAGEFDQPGFYTFQRGDSSEAQSRWGHTKNLRNGLIVPDRLIHIYQGYGVDYTEPPEQDPHLVKTFTGLIDSITVNTDKSLTIQFRDLGRALMDTIWWPDVVPWSQYYQGFETIHLDPGPEQSLTSTEGKWIRPTYVTDSNVPYIGRGFDDGGRPYVQSNGGVNGHLGKHAFDTSKKSYWLSVGNYNRWSSAYEYVQGKFKAGSVNKVKITAYGGPYTVYVSVGNAEGWKGNAKIPYRARVVDTNADIKFVKRFTIKKGETKTVNLPKTYTNINKVRITLADLWDSGVGKYQYRAGLADVQVFKSNSTTQTIRPLVHKGNIRDYTGAIAWILAWGGFFWPNDSSGFSFVTHANGDKINYTHTPDWHYPPPSVRRVLPHGRIWGDLMMTGTSPKVAIPFDKFDKQPLSDCIAQIKEIIGFNFYIDETGGVIWRLPNIYSLGNYVSDPNGGPNSGRTTDYVTLDENQTILGMSSVVSSKNIRERIFVANTTGKFGAMTEGYNPYKSGLRRYAGWTDTNFESQEEVKVMADFIALRQYMTFRQNSITIAANPAIQIDDQVKVYEKITSDTYFHYVNGISSEFDNSTGRWTYTLTTSWLGEDPDAPQKWVVDKQKLDALTRSYLKKLGV
jgi:hypothetical protein